MYTTDKNSNLKEKGKKVKFQIQVFVISSNYGKLNNMVNLGIIMQNSSNLTASFHIRACKYTSGILFNGNATVQSI